MEIRNAGREDAEIIYGMISDLAEFENKSGELMSTVGDIEKLCFSEKLLNCIILSDNGSDIGFASYFYMISTFAGRKILFVEDLYVSPEHRRRGCGRMLLQELERIAAKNGCKGTEWKCLRSNSRAAEFYRDFGAFEDTEWMTFKKNFNKFP